MAQTIANTITKLAKKGLDFVSSLSIISYRTELNYH